ncbi:MAG: hypothetical protein ACI9GZ_002726, partial [Bacteroidia bacterium]
MINGVAFVIKVYETLSSNKKGNSCKMKSTQSPKF